MTDSEKKKKKNDNSDSPQQQRNPMIWIVGGVIGFLVLLVIVGAIISAARTATTNSAYGEAIARLCEEPPAEEATMANLPPGDSPAPVLLLRSYTSQRHYWHGDLPEGWGAASGDEVRIVGCVFVDTEEIESCDYLRVGAEQDTYTASIERMQTTATITLLNTRGTPIAEETVVGSAPPPCPPDSADLNTTQTLAGSEPTLADFETWMAPFVEGAAG